MSNKYNREKWDEDTLLKVWEKGQVVQGVDPARYRKDSCDAWMEFSKHGENCDFGWHVDHIVPVKRLKDKRINVNVFDRLENLRPMQYENNISKGDSYPNYTAEVTSDGNRNVYKEHKKIVNEQVRVALINIYGETIEQE